MWLSTVAAISFGIASVVLYCFGYDAAASVMFSLAAVFAFCELLGLMWFMRPGFSDRKD